MLGIIPWIAFDKPCCLTTKVERSIPNRQGGAFSVDLSFILIGLEV